MAIDSGRNGRNGGWRKYLKWPILADNSAQFPDKINLDCRDYPRQTGMGYEDAGTGNDFAFRNYASRLPEVYSRASQPH
jgi:hypothetical protein